MADLSYTRTLTNVPGLMLSPIIVSILLSSEVELFFFGYLLTTDADFALHRNRPHISR